MRVRSSAAVRSNAGRVSSSLPGSRAGRGCSSGSAADRPGTRADLAHAIAEADDVVEPLPGELAQVLGAPPASRARHHPDGVGMQRLGPAAALAASHGAAGQPLAERLGHLRARAVARAQEQDARERGARARSRRRPGCSAAPALDSSSPQRASSRGSRSRGRRRRCGASRRGRRRAAGAGGTRPGSGAGPPGRRARSTRRSLRASSLSSRHRNGCPASRRKGGGALSPCPAEAITRGTIHQFSLMRLATCAGHRAPRSARRTCAPPRRAARR